MSIGWLLRGSHVAALVGAVLVWAAPGVAVAAGWRDQSYVRDGFAIAAPAPPKISTRTADSPEGKVEIRVYESDYPDADHPYQVFVSKYPADVDEQKIIRWTKDRQLKAVKGAAISDEHDVALDGVAGADYIVTFPGATLHVRMFVKGNTTYQAIVGWKDGTSPGDFDRFFASFRFTSK